MWWMLKKKVVCPDCKVFVHVGPFCRHTFLVPNTRIITLTIWVNYNSLRDSFTRFLTSFISSILFKKRFDFRHIFILSAVCRTKRSQSNSNWHPLVVRRTKKPSKTFRRCPTTPRSFLSQNFSNFPIFVIDYLRDFEFICQIVIHESKVVNISYDQMINVLELTAWIRMADVWNLVTLCFT